MIGLIKSGIRLTFLIASYAIVISWLTPWGNTIAQEFVLNGVPPEIITVIGCTVSTLNWIFGNTIIDIALTIWLLIPPVKLTLYFGHKVATI